MPKISLIVATLGRDVELIRLFESLEKQSLLDFEVIVVDQNSDRRVSTVLSKIQSSFPIIHLHRGDIRGLSLSRNVGIAHSSGDFLMFPDDDCWYPSWLLKNFSDTADKHAADIVAGRAADENGRSINARYVQNFTEITFDNAFETQIEWMVFVKRQVLDQIGGFDVELGVGAPTPWQSCEGPDLVLRALKKGFKAYFDPALHGYHHELILYEPSRALRAKALAYAFGMGFVMRKHGYSLFFALYRCTRPLLRMAIALLRFNFAKANYYFVISRGRFEGYMWPSIVLERYRRL